MATEVAPQAISESLRRHIEENRKFAAEWRERYGDPAESLGALLREMFTPDAFYGAIAAYREDRSSWLEDDLSDDDRWEDDGR